MSQANGDSHPQDDAEAQTPSNYLTNEEIAAVRKLLFRGAGGEEDEGGEFHSEASNVFEAVAGLLDRIDELEDQVQELNAQLETETNRTMGTKIAEAKRLARDDLLEQSKKYEKSDVFSPSVDQPTVTTMARPQKDIAPNTVYDAFEELSDQWDCFEVRDGDPGPEGKNKRLCIPKGRTIPGPLWEASDVESP